MKNQKILTLSLLFLFGSFFVSAAETTSPEKSTNERVEQLQNRVREIQSMDFSSMERAERKEVRRELKSIEKQLKAEGLDSKVSVSIGAIIIVVLLILLL